MRSFLQIILSSCAVLILAGCGDTLADIKDAASGINSKANEAATAISQDVHSIRAIEIVHNDKTFTVNDLFKNILRDVQWHYEKDGEINILRINGTWQPDLFASQNFDASSYPSLVEYGEVQVILHVQNEDILANETSATLSYKGNEIFSEKGEDLLLYFYDYYINR